MIPILILPLTVILPLISAQPFDYPTAKPGTRWTNSPSLNHTISYPDGAAIRALLLKGSSGPSFACGFFCTAPCTSFLFSIFIVQTNSGSGITGLRNASPQVVWSANRDRPVGENATLDFSEEGGLVLRDFDGSYVWSTNIPSKSATTMAINGNAELTLLDRSGGRVWSSVDYPTACGEYGICSSGQCTCPVGGGRKSYFRPVVERRPDFGCSLLSDISCESKQKQRLLSLENIAYFGYSASTAADVQGTSAEVCKGLCLKRCECKAAFFQYGGDALHGSCFLVSRVFTLIDNNPEITHFNSSASAIIISSCPVAKQIQHRADAVTSVAVSYQCQILHHIS